MKPIVKLPLSPKNIFGSLNIEKLKKRKIIKVEIMINKYSSMFSSGDKKNKIMRTANEVDVNEPSKPSK